MPFTPPKRLALLLWALLSTSAIGETCAEFHTRDATFTLDTRGSFTAIGRSSDGRNYLAPGQPAPLLSLRTGGKLLAPTTATWSADSRRLHLGFGAAGITAIIRADPKPTHLTLELLEIQTTNAVEIALWGPYPTTIGEIIGEVIGVVRDTEFAVGIQALNARTLGGHPSAENDIESEYGADDTGSYPNLPAELGKGQSFRGDTARHAPFGSVLQAYCRNRDRDRVIENWGHERYVAPAYRDGGIIGTRIALFACPARQALETLGAIEIAENLPHPLLDGVWAKTSPLASASYLIVDFSEQNVDRAIEMTRRAGLGYLYHSSPFETWGHFTLKKSLFPNGWDGLRACVEKARKQGVRIGFHTLSNFITPNDSYVTPKPDPRLARIGTSTLASAVDESTREIPIAAPDYFRKTTDMNTVVIGDELVKYASASTNAPWRLLDCQRGAWGTHASAHAAGAAVGKLMDHGYKVFLTDADLTREVARNIARLCNHAGTMQISLDGLEGGWSTGMGQYGRTLLTQSWYEALDPSLRGTINDASNPGHFNWHVYTRMNWGEPWYAGFRESQTLYRFKNQLHFERNLMPHMLGWFALRADTSLEDAEWLLARAAGFDAGFALASSLASTAQLEAAPDSASAVREFGALPTILAAINAWETARMTAAFPPEIKARLRDNSREFHLTSTGPGQWDLREAHVAKATHDAQQTSPTFLEFNPPAGTQALHWNLHSVSKKPISGVRLEINGHVALDLGDVPLPPGGNVRYTGGSEASVCDSNWKETSRAQVNAAAASGPGILKVSLRSAPQDATSLKLELRALGPAERVSSPASARHP